MHQASLDMMKQFVDKYLSPDKELKILDIGSVRDGAQKTYKDFFKNYLWTYHGLDLVEGENVDIVSKNLYDYPIESNSYDIIISGQTIEHVENLHSWIRELSRILKNNGIICIIGPNCFHEHRYPVDCWRIFPDGMRFLLEKIAGFKVLECFINLSDTVGIAQKERI